MTTRVGIIAFDYAEVLDVMGPFEVFAVARAHQFALGLRRGRRVSR